MAAPEYSLQDTTAPENVDDVSTPLEGFSEDERVARGHGILRIPADSYLPLPESWLSETVVSIEPRSYYFHSDNAGVVREEWAAGGRAALVTGWWRDMIRFGSSVYTSQALYAPPGKTGTGILKRDGGGYWSPGEAFAEIRNEDGFQARLFRQELDIPFLNRNDSRMTPRTHEAYLAKGQLSPELLVAAGHVSKVRARTGEEFLPLAEAAGAIGSDEGASLAGFFYEAPDEESSFGLLHIEGWDTFRTTYGEGTREWDLPGKWDLSTSSQLVLQSDIGEALLGQFETHAFGGSADLGLGPTVATFSVTHVADGATVMNPWGGTPLFNSLMISDFDRAGETAMRVGLSRKFDDIGLPGFSGFANYANGNTPDSGPAASPDQDEFNITFDFRPESGPLEGFWLRVRHGWNDKGAAGTREDLRIILNHVREF